MKFAYEDLSDAQFEHLVVLICQRLLGMGVQGFATGVDGGRDAKFIGTAQLIPSTSAPWSGTVIIQAKHTNGYNRSCSETDFFSTTSDETVVGKEVPRVRKLRDGKQLDHYMLFTNRRLTGNAESDIRTHIATEGGLTEQSVMLCGLESLELWLKSFPDIPATARLDPFDSPLVVSPDELAEVVEALARHLVGAATVMDMPPAPRTLYETKNAINKMSEAYAKSIRRLYLKDTAQVKTFLAAPENDDLLRMYESTVAEFQLKIIAKRKDYQSFDEVMNYLMDLLFARDPILRRNRKLTRVMLFYMYWNCDIGESEDA